MIGPTWLTLINRLGVVLMLLLLGTLTSGSPSFAADLALVGAKVYTSPTSPPIEDGAVLVRDGLVYAVGQIKPPRGVAILNCNGLVVTAGFWNSHVHILTPGLLHAEKLSDGEISKQLEEMLTRWGFTTVFDIASVLDNTTLIRRRIEGGEVKGPRILTVGEPIWSKGATAVYVKDFLAANGIDMPEVESSAQAVDRVRRQLLGGADGIKIFSGSFAGGGRIVLMPLDIAKAVVAEAHRAGKPVFAHPSNIEGIDLAIKSGADVLVHTAPMSGPWSPFLVSRMKAKRIALVPTLTLFEVEGKKFNESTDEVRTAINTAVGQLKVYSEAGAEILFGTDVGYIDYFDTTREFTLMARAGLSYQQILASLTTNPAGRFGFSRQSGRIAKGMQADLVVLDGDPAKDVTAFSRVRYTIRGGRVIYAAH